MARQARHELWLRVAVWHEETVASHRVKYKAHLEKLQAEDLDTG